MENELFLNGGISGSAIPIWPSAMEIQATNEMNCSSELSSHCFFNPNNKNNNWEKSIDHSLQFDSALSSMVSSPVASNSNVSNESFVIRELIGKLGNFGTSREISPIPMAAPYTNGDTSANTSCYTSPLNSSPKLNNNLPIMDQFVKEKLPILGNSIALNSTVAEFSADPGFAERAARFSPFGSRSFNGRTSLIVPNTNPEFVLRSNPIMANEKLPRVSSSPSLKILGSQGNKNPSPLQNGSELASNSQEGSSVSEQIPIEDSSLKPSNKSNSRKRKSAKATEANENSNNKRSKPNEGTANENGAVKSEEETTNEGDDKEAKSNAKPPEPPKDYIHVRARRGQATDSHSLAERVRREKISERMKLLQDLVPGCNKVTGKALMLDEIINYVQSLQQQVEFLSMKLASIDTRLDFNVDALMSKEMYQPNKPLTNSIFTIDSTASAFLGHHPQQNPAFHGNICNVTMNQCPVDPLENALCRNNNMQLPLLHQFTETIPHQYPNFCEDDLQSIVQMGFAQNPNFETSLQSQSFPGSNQESHMKFEL